MTRVPFRAIVTVTLNPTIDRIIEVPGFHVGGHLQGRLRLREPAGKAINVSRALAALGVPNTAIGWVGMHTFDLFHESLERSGVKPCFIPISGPTRENITIIDPAGASDTHIRDTGPCITPADVDRLTDLLQSVAGPNMLIVFTGSLPPGLSIEDWVELIEACTSRKSPVAIDTAGEPLRAARRRRPWMIKPNEKELRELVGRDLAGDEAIVDAGRKLAADVPVLLVTLGQRGAYCFSEDQVIHGRTTLPAGQVRSTVGCGDAMLAGFLAAIMDPERDIASCLEQGLLVSAASAMSEQPACFDKANLDALRPYTQVNRVA